MSSRNSTIIIGRVKLKSKSAAFSISFASEGGAKASELAAKREMDLRVEAVRHFENLKVGIFGSEI